MVARRYEPVVAGERELGTDAEAFSSSPVHENTVRYRMGRVQELLGVDVVNDSEAQLAMQLAITVHRLAAPA